MSKPKDCTIADVLDMRRPHDEGDVIGSISGKIKKVWDYRTGQGKHGDWSFQNLELVDGRDSIKIVLKDREELSARDWEGLNVIISSTDGKNGWTGVKAKDDEYKGKVNRICWVTGSADIAEDRGGARTDRREEPRDERPPREEPRREDDRPAPRQEQNKETSRTSKPLGVTVGMAINNACLFMVHNKEPYDTKAITQRASDILRVAKWLEDGNLLPKQGDKPAAKPKETPPPPPPPPAPPEEDAPPF